MDCLLCAKLFIEGKEFKNYKANPELCQKVFSKLYGISNQAVQGLSEDLLICLVCHQRLEKLEELQRKVEEERIAIQSDMVNSNETIQARAKKFENRMSQSSLHRCTILRAIGAVNSPPPQDQVPIDPAEEDGNESEMEDETEVQTQSPDTTAQFGEEMETESEQGSSRSSAGSNCTPEESNDDEPETRKVHSQIKRKAGRALWKRMPVLKPFTQEEVSSEEEDGSDSEAGDESEAEVESESESEASVSSEESGEVNQGGGSQPRRAPGSIVKEFDLLEDGSYRCKQCPSILTRKRSLWAHLLIHGPKRFQCSVQGCGGKFALQSILTKHAKSVHGERGKFRCTWKGCRKRFTQKTRLVAHVKSSHVRRRDFQCSWEGCEKAYLKKQHLNEHVKVYHEKRKDFVCGVGGCDEAFARRDRLQKHILANHVEKEEVVAVKASNLAKTTLTLLWSFDVERCRLVKKYSNRRE